MDRILRRIPLFPLEVVLMPGTPLPLHIFEERYRKMIRRCRETDEEFGVVTLSNRTMSSAGCTARITDVLKEYDDGRLDIMTQGKRRFFVAELHEELPYLEGTVHYFADDPVPVDGAIEAEMERGIELFKKVSTLADVPLDPEFLYKLSAEELSFVLAGTSATGLEERRKLLELRSTQERLHYCISSLEQTAERMELQKRVEEAVGKPVNIEELRN
ncbi:LON peptidase substrate-binding domain-containing protein [Salinispira pacifica]